MSNISKKEVQHIAKLAELEFGDEELQKITSQLDKILGHIAVISRADTEDIRPTSHTLKINNVFRDDTEKPSLSQEEALKNAPEESAGGFAVPKID